MKKFYALLLALAMCLTFCACNTDAAAYEQELRDAQQTYQQTISALEEENEQLKAQNAELLSAAEQEYEKGLAEGQASGYADGYDAGYSESYQQGYDAGYSESYQQGYDAGCADTKLSYESAGTSQAPSGASSTSSTSSASYDWLSTQEPEPEPDPAPSDSTSYTVYITKTGTKYHSSGCSYLKKSKISISKDSAIAQGYTACSRCNP